MCKRLWEVAHQALCARVVLFAEQPNIVAQREQPLDEFLGLPVTAYAPQRVDYPEAADQERALASCETVVGLVCSVAKYEAVFGQLAADRLDGTDHPLVVVGQKPHARDKQRAGVQRPGAVSLGEGSPSGVVAFLQDVGVDLVTHGAPALHGTIEPETLDALDHTVKRHPAHDLGVDEVLPLPA